MFVTHYHQHITTVWF